MQRLPANGPLWQRLRNGHIDMLHDFSERFQHLLKRMLHPDPEQRPAAAEVEDLVSNLCLRDNQSNSELISEIAAHKKKIMELEAMVMHLTQ